MRLLALAIALSTAAGPYQDAKPIRALIVDGQNNHDWKSTTPVLVETLEATGRFEVEVTTAPAQGEDMSGFRPDFASHDLVISNYNGEPWPESTRAALEEYVSGGGGLVIVHAADNAFPDWPAYNRMIGLGGWGGRDESDGPYIRYRSGEFVRDESAGRGGSHGKRHPFEVVVRDPEHPITRGLPKVWKHAEDELYDRLRGPAEHLTVLATAYSDPATGGTGEHEPMLMVIAYGDGRVFHTTLGHDTTAMSCAGFRSTLARGAEWAATGTVTLPVPDDFPTEKATSTR